jgi:hypothetical protein
MENIDKQLLTTQQAPPYTPSTEQAAWFAIVYTAVTMDGMIRDPEREALCKLLVNKKMYTGHEIIDCYFEAVRAKETTGTKEIIRRAAKLVNAEDAPTLFCIVAETLLAGRSLNEKEEDILEHIRRSLKIDEDLTRQIIEVILIKNKGNSLVMEDN